MCVSRHVKPFQQRDDLIDADVRASLSASRAGAESENRAHIRIDYVSLSAERRLGLMLR